eukprot:367566_1
MSNNPYRPKTQQEVQTVEKRHIYNISAHFDKDVLCIEVFDAIQRTQFRNEFNQSCFPHMNVRNVAKELIDAVNLLCVGKHDNNVSDNESHPINIYEYNHWCYLTVNGTKLPSFALRPFQKSASV